MASKLTTCFLSRNFCGYNCEHPRSVLYASTSYRLPPAACKMRHSNSSSQHKRKQMKKSSLQQLQMNVDLHTNRNEDLEQQNMPIDDLSLLKKEAKSHGSSENDVPVPHVDEADSSTALEKLAISSGSVENCVPVTHVDEAGCSTEVEIPAITSGTAQHDVPVTHVDEVSTLTAIESKRSVLPSAYTSEAIEIDEAEHLSGVQVEDLLSMVKNAEKNILLLNQARVRALEYLDKILAEKQALQEEISALEMKLAETDARIGVASEETIHVKLLKDELEKLRNELNDRETSERRESLPFDNQNGLLNDYTSPTHRGTVDSLTNELSSLREENASLKCDVESLKSELTQVRSMNKRVEILEKERSLLESDVKELESKLAISQEDVLKLSALQEECKDLWDKVGNLQNLLDKATNQSDQAFTMLQQNQELRKKVDKLEESLEEANAYRLSSEKIQHYNELMQQKIRLLEDHLQTSDEEINSYVQLYQESVKEFQQTLDTLKEESHRRAQDKPVDDMPWDFWSNLLIQIDGWLLGKKISMDDSKILRDMVWKRDGQVRDAYFACKDKTENEVVNTFLKLISSPTGPGLYIVHIAAEMAPVAKVGGLGDVVTGLGKALQRKGHLIEIVLPKYDCMQYEHVQDLRALDVVIGSYFDGRLFKNKIWAGTVEGLPVYFIEPHHPDKFFWRKQFYGEYDDFRRFSFFSRAALEFLLHAGKKPDIIHCHDWQTAFVAPLYWDVYAPKGLNSARICFTCHNFEYQGTAPASEIASCGLDVHQFNRPDRMQDNDAHDRVNPVKGGVVFSNIVTTVSPTYAQEVRTAEGGRGLHSTLNFHAKKFIGILNGVDADAWNPATDKFLKVQYTATDFEGKAENKESLRRKLGLSSADIKKPLVGCITRLVPQKGVHLIRHAIYRTLELEGQFVLLGSSPVHHIQREFEGIANSFQNHDHIRLILKYDDALSHCIYAASDMFIIPSIFEPCGLTQMIAMRYGSIPIARKTGGINDSVFDVDDDTIPPQFRNGFTFLTPDEKGLNGALDRAFNLYMNEPERWHELMQNDMKIDFSWDSPSTQYVELYSKSVARARAATRV